MQINQNLNLEYASGCYSRAILQTYVPRKDLRVNQIAFIKMDCNPLVNSFKENEFIKGKYCNE